MVSNPSDEHVSLEEEENTVRSKMLRGEDCLESDEGDLHGEEGTSNVEDTVSNVKVEAESVDDDEEDNENGDDVDNEGITTPRSNHVEVSQRGDHGPEWRSGVDCLEESVETVYKGENSNTFVIVRSGD